MDKLTTTLLTGAALGALSVAPAMATTHHPMLAVRTAHGAMTVRGIVHSKTSIHTPGVVKYTFTFPTTFKFTGNESTMYKNPIDLQGIAWYTVSSGGHCVDIPGQKAHAILDPNAKIKMHTSKAHITVSACTGTLTFYGPAYRLNNKNASSDTFKWLDKVRYTTTSTGGAVTKHTNTAVANWAITI